MRMHLGPLAWLDGYRLEKTKSLIKRGMQRTLSSYVTAPIRRADSVT